jgi:Mesyanzhinovviridae DNA polymerase
MATLPSWAGAGRVGLDVETYDPHLKETGPSVRTGGCLVGISFALEDGPAYYLPFGHRGGGNLPAEAVLTYVRAQAAAYAGTIVGANLNYDLDWLASAGVVFPAIKRQRDVQVADPLLDELHNSYSLDAVARRWGFPGKDTGLLNDAMRNYGLKSGEMYKLHSKYVGAYAEEDARLPLLINRKQERALEAEGLWDIYDLESEVQPVLLAMRRRGIRVDLGRLDEVEAWALREEQLALSHLKAATGVAVAVGGVWEKEPIVRALGAAGVTLERTPSGQPKVDKALLKASDTTAAKAILRARKVSKLRTTFCASVRTHLVGDRVHPTYNQLATTREDGDTVGARYGRLSNEHPNLQQQPIRDEFGPMWRGIYVPDAGARWACIDYNQQEPRLLTHYAELLGLPGAAAAADRYRADPRTDNHRLMTVLVYGQARWDAWTAAERKHHRDQCKQVYLALCYGMGGGKLARTLGLTTEWKTNTEGKPIEVAGPEAQALLDAFNAGAPFVRALARYCTQRAEQRGYIRTLLGRRCRFPLRPDGRYDWAHKAINRLIQGGAADQIKRAMVDLHRAGHPLQLQVHDELDLSVESAAQAHAVAALMCSSVELNVPSVVDVELGPSWGELKAA